MMAHDDFVIDPLPNLLFTRDSGLGARPGRGDALAMPARKRETTLTEPIYRHHPRFAGTPSIHGHTRARRGRRRAAAAPGVIAVGVGERTTPAGRRAAGPPGVRGDLAHTVLAVPIAQERATMHLDTVCTMVDVDTVVMYPNVADSLVAHAVTPTAGGRGHGGGSRAAAVPRRGRAAMGIDRCASTPASTR